MKESRVGLNTENHQQWMPIADPVSSHVQGVKHKLHLQFYGKKNGQALSQLMRSLAVAVDTQEVFDTVPDLAYLETGREDGRQSDEGRHLCPR